MAEQDIEKLREAYRAQAVLIEERTGGDFARAVSVYGAIADVVLPALARTDWCGDEFAHACTDNWPCSAKMAHRSIQALADALK